MLWKQNSTSPSIYNNKFNAELTTPPQVKLECQDTYVIWEIKLSKNSFLIVVYFGQEIKEKWWIHVFYLSLSEEHIEHTIMTIWVGLHFVIFTYFIVKKNNETLWFLNQSKITISINRTKSEIWNWYHAEITTLSAKWWKEVINY